MNSHKCNNKKMFLVALVIIASIASVFAYKKMKTFNIFKREQELTLAIIKPDAVAAKNTGKIIDIIEQTGFDIVGLEKITLNKEKAEQFYAVHKDRPFYNDLVKFMTEGPVVVIALSKENAVADWRNLMGATNPENADSNTIRKLFGTSIQRNATHGSDSVENAKNEVKFFFPNIK